MDEWKTLLKNSITDKEALEKCLGAIPFRLGEVIAKYPMKINPYYFSLIDKKNWQNDPIARQCIPDIRELTVQGGEDDPLSEDGSTSSPSIIHKYKYGVVYMVSNACAMYCRFCTRKRKVGISDNGMSSEALASGLEYIRRNPSIKEVILSGGDPLLLGDDRIEEILRKLRGIKHVEWIRIGSRTPVTLPSRITPRALRYYKEIQPGVFSYPLQPPFRAYTSEQRCLQVDS